MNFHQSIVKKRKSGITLRFRRRRGVAQAIAVFLLMIILIAAIYIPLNYAVSQYQALQASLWPTNVYDSDSLAFVNNYWLWLPIIVFFTGIGYVYMKAQKRTFGE